MAMIGTACALVALMWIGLTVLHIAALAFIGATKLPGARSASAVILMGLMTVGMAGLWLGLRTVPLPLQISALCLYLAGVIVYLELRSLLSRGYSLRILVDVLCHPEGTSLARLQDGYGNGVGLRGLLTRRITTLSRLHLVRFDGQRVGPLTVLGVLCAALTAGMRKLLRLELVG